MKIVTKVTLLTVVATALFSHLSIAKEQSSVTFEKPQKIGEHVVPQREPSKRLTLPELAIQEDDKKLELGDFPVLIAPPKI